MAKTLSGVRKPNSIVKQLQTDVRKVNKPKKEKESWYQVQLPDDLLTELKMDALKNKSSVRSILLQGLKKMGYKIEDISDRRRTSK
jgi:hypothetical protein